MKSGKFKGAARLALRYFESLRARRAATPVLVAGDEASVRREKGISK